MKPIPLNGETRALARRLIWFQTPEEALADPVRFMAYAFARATHEEMKALRARCTDKVRLARERAQEQYDELCADYREYQLKSKAEFMALFNEYEAFKKQHGALQAENARMSAHTTEQTQFITQMQAHADGWQDRLDVAVRAKDDEVKAKQEEVLLLSCF